MVAPKDASDSRVASLEQALAEEVRARQAAEARTERLSRLWSVVRAINKEVLHVRSDRQLFDTACRIVVELGHFHFAWIGLVNADRTRVEPVASAGSDGSYLERIRIDVAPTPYGLGPTGVAVREGRHSLSNDWAQDPAVGPWREKAVARGFLSGGAFPLRCGERIVGALSVYANRARFFDDEQVALLEGLASDIGYALDLLDHERRRRDAEEAMRLSEERHRLWVEKASDGIVMIDADRRFFDANEAACRIMGRSREELLQLRVDDVVETGNLAVDPLRFSKVPVGGVIITDRRVVRKDGSFVDIEVSTKAFEGGRFQSVMRDVTERKSTQAQLLLADRMASLGRLASGVAHEVNNPLAYVMLNLELIAKALPALGNRAEPIALQSIGRALSDAREGADRVRRIVRMLSAFGRGDEDHVGPVEVGAVLDSAAEIAAMQLRHRARLIKEYSADAPARANAFRLGQVFVNLLVNAADALGDDEQKNEIRLRTYLEGGRVVIEVADSGAGIPPEVRARIFDPFFTTKPIGKGTGLGLSVCHAIVVSFGGEIQCNSVPGQGTTFRVSLPRATLESDEAPPPSARRPVALRGRVLVVDDDARVAAAVAASLDGADVVVATSGREALERARSERFDCVVCDLIMPDVSGVDIYDALKADGRGAESRLVFLTGGAVTDAARALVARVSNTVLEKPIDADALRASVARLVEKTTAR